MKIWRLHKCQFFVEEIYLIFCGYTFPILLKWISNFMEIYFIFCGNIYQISQRKPCHSVLSLIRFSGYFQLISMKLVICGLWRVVLVSAKIAGYAMVSSSNSCCFLFFFMSLTCSDFSTFSAQEEICPPHKTLHSSFPFSSKVETISGQIKMSWIEKFIQLVWTNTIGFIWEIRCNYLLRLKQYLPLPAASVLPQEKGNFWTVPTNSDQL